MGKMNIEVKTTAFEYNLYIHLRKSYDGTWLLCCL